MNQIFVMQLFKNPEWVNVKFFEDSVLIGCQHLDTELDEDDQYNDMGEYLRSVQYQVCLGCGATKDYPENEYSEWSDQQ